MPARFEKQKARKTGKKNKHRGTPHAVRNAWETANRKSWNKRPGRWG